MRCPGLPSLTPHPTPQQEAYLFQAALSELKTGSQVKLRNDSITLRSLTANLQRETDGLQQKMKEDMQRLSSDIQVRHISPSSRRIGIPPDLCPLCCVATARDERP